MDLLGSILNSMDKPPSANEEQKKLIKRHKEMTERLKNKQKEELYRFRKYVEERIGRFAKDDRHHIEFQPLDKIHRAIIHEVAEYGGFICMSFGCEDVDRYSVIYKKENAPTEDEIAARRNGDGWNEDIAKEYAEMRIQRELENEQKRLARASSAADAASAKSNSSAANNSANSKSSNSENEIKPTFNYKDKYVHLIGQDAALKAARKTETNQQYGFVPSKNKKDIRSIEQTLADIQAKKKLKLQLKQQEEQQEQEQQEQQQQQQQQLQQQTDASTTENKVSDSPTMSATTTTM